MSGLFTIGQPELHTGRGHMVSVKCDLCSVEETFDPAKVHAVDAMHKIFTSHQCKKPEVKPPNKVKKVLKKIFGEYQIGTRRKPEAEYDDL